MKQNLHDDIRFSKLLEKYPLGDGSEVRAYEFFSMFIHPRCEMDPKILKALVDIRKMYVDNVLNYVFEYLKSCDLLWYDDDALDFDHEFFYNPLLVNNVTNVKGFEYLIHLIKKQLCFLPKGEDVFTWQFLERVRYIVIDMMISISLGYREHVIAIFKSFVEEYSVFFAIGSVESQEDFDQIKHAYWVTSRIQLDAHFEKLGMNSGSTPEDEIQKLYDEYYKEKYGLKDYKKFYWELRRNSLYFLGKEKKSYNKYVRGLIENVFSDDEHKSKEAMTLYRISKDMSHASGYNFNATASMVDAYAQKVLIYTYQFLLHFIINASLTLEEHKIKTDVKPLIDAIKDLQSMHFETLNKIIKETMELSQDKFVS